jgi:hypothetical protein
VSKFPVGSSARIIEGLFTKALAMATAGVGHPITDLAGGPFYHPD